MSTQRPGTLASETGGAAAERLKSPPFFVVGVQRSGTTMLRLMLDSHPSIAVPFETGFITVFFHKLCEYGDLRNDANRRRLLNDIRSYHKVRQGDLIGNVDDILRLPVASYSDLVDTIMTQFAHRQNKIRWGDKTPFYISDMDVLYRVFPNCRIIHLVRDGRDVALSQRGVSWAPSNIPRIAKEWAWRVTLARKIGNVLGPQYLEVQYESLVANPELVLRQICTFIDEPFAESMLAYHENGESRMPEKSMAWHKSSVRPPDQNKVRQWRYMMSPTDRILFENEAGEALELFGYELERRRSTIRSRLKSLYFSTFRRR